jgi:hypothetical protein
MYDFYSSTSSSKNETFLEPSYSSSHFVYFSDPMLVSFSSLYSPSCRRWMSVDGFVRSCYFNELRSLFPYTVDLSHSILTPLFPEPIVSTVSTEINAIPSSPSPPPPPRPSPQDPFPSNRTSSFSDPYNGIDSPMQLFGKVIKEFHQRRDGRGMSKKEKTKKEKEKRQMEKMDEGRLNILNICYNY